MDRIKRRTLRMLARAEKDLSFPCDNIGPLIGWADAMIEFQILTEQEMKPKHVPYDNLVEKVWRLERLLAWLIMRDPTVVPVIREDPDLFEDFLKLQLSISDGGTED